jgi:acetoacetyl-CoA synthetase
MQQAQRTAFVPQAGTVERAQLAAFIRYCAVNIGHSFGDYADFERFAVRDFRRFWRMLAEWSRLPVEGALEPVCIGDTCESAKFFPQLRLNYAESLLEADRQDSDRTALTALGSGYRRQLSVRDLRDRVWRLAAGLHELGIRPGDHVAAVLRNDSEAVVAALATAAVGGVFSSCGPDMGSFAVLNRFSQLEPVLMMTHLEPAPHDTGTPLAERVGEMAAGLPSLRAVIALDGSTPPKLPIPVYALRDLLARPQAKADHWQRFPFNHPLFAMFSSGTTGKPKCILHGAGGTLIEHVKEHRLHCDLRHGDKLFFQTNCAWMMWQWQLSALASGAEIVLYDGPLDRADALWRIVAQERVTVFGTSPAYLKMCENAGLAPRTEFDLRALRSILSTGSILYDQQYDWVSDQVSPAIPLQSISGGTDIIGCFVLGNPILPVYRGEAQCRSLGLDVRSLPSPDNPQAAIGELVCANPFPSRPVGFAADPDGSRFHKAYFSQNAGLWTHGDLIEFTKAGGARLHGRSDGSVNIRGIRIGPAEIYRILQDIPEVLEALAVEQRAENVPGGTRLVLLVVLRAGAVLDGALVARIRRELAQRGSGALVPDVVIRLDELPVTHNGKRSEAAARDAVNGRLITNRTALRNPTCLDTLAEHPALRETMGVISQHSEGLEGQLKAIWEHCFGFSPIGIDDDFFELGGHSILAARILASLREIADRELPLSTLLYAPTIRRLAELARTAAWEPFSSVVTLRAGSRSRPFFLVHGLGGNVLELIALVQALRTSRAVLALQARGLEPGRAPHTSVQSMAADYVDEIQRIQPRGPYAIAGFSFGGLVAFEMTQILHARGEAVEFLGLIDTDVPEHALPLGPWVGLQWDRLRRHWHEFRSYRDRGQSSRHSSDAIGRVWLRLKRQPDQGRWHVDMRLPPLLNQVREAAIVAFAKYKPRRYAGRVVLLRAASRTAWVCDPLPTWKHVARGGLDVVLIPSDHLGLVQEPAVRQLALALDRCLEPQEPAAPISKRPAFPGRQHGPIFDLSAAPDNPGARFVSEQRDLH